MREAGAEEEAFVGAGALAAGAGRKARSRCYRPRPPRERASVGDQLAPHHCDGAAAKSDPVTGEADPHGPAAR